LERIIITGGSGFIGRQLVEKVLSKKLSSIALIANTSNFHKNQFENIKLNQDSPLTFYTVDIRDKKKISEVFEHEKPETCIHLAAKISVVDSIKNPRETMDVNVNGTRNILEACYNSKVKNFVLASSAAVYGDVRELPIKESSTLGPISPYGTSKMLAEEHVSLYRKLKKIENAVILRIFNVYGYGQASGADVITRFVARLSRGLPPVIYGNGIQTRDFISVDDVVHGILLSIKLMERRERNMNNDSSSPLVFNLGTGVPTSINQLVQKMIDISGLDLCPIHYEGKEDDRVILHSYADIGKARAILHFAPKKGIDKGLREMIEPIPIRK
jgi:UDP-glucose 4-epimerase